MSKTILIVDDSATMRMMVADTLRQAGFQVLEGVHGEDGLSKLQGRQVNLVITDYNMPVMGGIAFIHKMRAKPDCKFTPILVLTTETEESRKNEAKAAGATGWLVKPFDPSRLIQVVNRLVP